MQTCNNKLTTALLFEKFGIPTPRTATFFVSNEKNIDDAMKLIGNKFESCLKNSNRNARYWCCKS